MIDWDDIKSRLPDHQALALTQLLDKCRKLERGCHCDYDYRCGKCQTILDVKELAR